MTEAVQDLDDRLPWAVTGGVRPSATRPAPPTKEDIPARWRERSDLEGYVACSRRPSPEHDGTLIYTLETERPFPNKEQAHNARKYLEQKRAEPGVDFIVMELRAVL